eukprot:4634631-Pleurochrysis_carterae.AAC.1
MFWRTRDREKQSSKENVDASTAAGHSEQTVADILPQPPKLLHYGLPLQVRCLASDPLHGTVAVGCLHGEVKLFARSGAEVLLGPQHHSPVLHLVFAPLCGKLVVVHSPNNVCTWALHPIPTLDTAVPLPQTLTSELITVACLAPLSSIVLFGTDKGSVRAYDAESSHFSPWSLRSSSGSASTASALCALEPNPTLSQRLLVGERSGRLRVFDADASRSGGSLVCSFEGAFADDGQPLGLSCATWSGPTSGSCRLVLAGYDDGRVHLFSLLNPQCPNQRFKITPYADGVCRPMRGLLWAGGPSSQPAHGPQSQPPSVPLLYAVGGTVKALEPDSLVLLRGEGLRDRAMVAPPRGAILGVALTSAKHEGDAVRVLESGAPACPSRLLLLSSTNELFEYELHKLGSAPRIYPQGYWAAAASDSAVRLRVAFSLGSSAGVRAHFYLTRSTVVRASTAEPSASAPRPEPAQVAPGPFFNPGVRAVPPSPVKSLLGDAAKLLDEGSNLGNLALAWLGLDVAEAGPEPKALSLEQLLFPPPPPSSNAAAGTAAASAAPGARARGTLERATREELLGGASASGKAVKAAPAPARRGGSRDGASNAMADGLRAAGERGEKLGELGDKTQKLADDADEFLSLASQLRKQQERPFFGLF